MARLAIPLHILTLLTAEAVCALGAGVPTIRPEILWTNSGGGRISFSPNGKLLTTLGPRSWEQIAGEYVSKRDVNFWSVDSGKLAGRFPLPPEEHDARWVRFAPDGKQVLVMDDSERVFLAAHRVKDGAVRWMVDRGLYGNPFHDVFFPPDGKSLLTISARSPDVELWRLKGGTRIEAWGTALPGYRGSEAGALSPEGKLLVMGGNLFKPDITVWNVATRSVLRTLPPVNVPQGQFAFGYAFSFSPDGEYLVVSHFGGYDFYIPSLGFMPLPVFRKWRVRDWSLVWEWVESHFPPYPLVHSPDGRYLATERSDGVLFRRADTGEHVLRVFTRFYEDQTGGISDIQFSPDGDRVAYSYGGVLVLMKTPGQLNK